MKKYKYVRFDDGKIVSFSEFNRNFNSYDGRYCKDIVDLLEENDMVRIEYFLRQYINGKSYADCIHPKDEALEYIKQIRTGKLGNSSLSIIAESNMSAIKALADAYVQNPNLNTNNPEVDKLFADICKEIIDTAFFAEYARNGEI